MELYVFSVSEIEDMLPDAVEGEVKCPSCGWRTTTLYVIAESRDEAEKMIREGEAGICGNCIAEMIATEGYTVMPNAQH